MAGNSGGPWGVGGNNGGDDRDRRGQRPQNGQGQVPDIDQLVRKGQDQLRVLMGGGGGNDQRGGSGGGSGFSRSTIMFAGLIAVVLWVLASVYRVQDGDNSVELFLGECRGECVKGAGLNFAPWPLETYEIIPASRQNSIEIGVGRGSRNDEGLMLTGDENIVDIDFEVVWNIKQAEDFLFNIAAPAETIAAVSESAMREIIGRSNLAPILNRDRGAVASELQELIQGTLDSYQSGINIVVVNFDKSDPPLEVIDAFREVQAAEQERDTLEKQADAYANSVVAGARGKAAQLIEEAEGYRAQVVNEAEGEASRFVAVYGEFAKAPDVTRKRLYLETMERVLGDVEKIIIDDTAGGGQGVVPYLPLNELRRSTGAQ